MKIPKLTVNKKSLHAVTWVFLISFTVFSGMCLVPFISDSESPLITIVAIVLVFLIGISFLILLSYLLIKLLRDLYKVELFRKFLRIVPALIIIFLIIDNYNLGQRLAKVEERFGGTQKLACSEQSVKDYYSKNVFRIIGSFGEGSGFPISEESIITNFHVIDGEPSPKVVFPDGSIETPWKIQANPDKDFAILTVKKKLETPKFHGWFGTTENSAVIAVGEPLYAFGYPLGSNIKGDPAMLKGSFSGRRFLKDVNMNTVEASLSLIPGMSGGPLVDSCGQVIGVNTIGVGGLSIFLDIEDVQKGYQNLSDKALAKTEINTATPEGAVKAFYTYIKARNLEKAFELFSDERKKDVTSFEEWTWGYRNTLQVNLVLTKVDEKDKNKVLVKLESQDWVDGEMQYKYFEGSWTVTDKLKLNESNIKDVENPPGWWFYSWNKPDWVKE